MENGDDRRAPGIASNSPGSLKDREEPITRSGGRRGFPTLFALASGIAGASAFPKLGWTVSAWVASLLISLALLKVRSPRAGFWCGFVSGITLAGLSLLWIPGVMEQFGGVPAWWARALLIPMALVLALFPAFACAATVLAMRRYGPYLLLMLPAAWISSELLLSYLPFGGFPWLATGYSQSGWLILAQVADLTGVYGVSFMVYWVGASVALAICRREGRAIWLPSAISVAAVAGCLVYGGSALRNWDRAAPTHSALLLQANIVLDEEWSRMCWRYGEGYLQMAAESRRSRADLVVLPESPSPLAFQRDAGYREAMVRLARQFPLGMIFNNINYAGMEEGNGYYNCAYFLDSGGRELGRYDKMRLVPFGEYVPLKKLLSFAQPIVKEVSSFLPGVNPLVVDLGPGRASALICYEAAFPQLARQFVERGSQLLVNLTNDSWYGDSAAPYQHLNLARWRAIENRRFLVRATNSGISACITPSGRITSATPLLQTATGLAAFTFIDYRSLYSRWGDWLPMACAIICFCLIAAALVPRGPGAA